MNAGQAQSSQVASPCIGICRLDDEQMCEGCGRTIEEIVEWSRATESRRRVIVGLADERMLRKGLPSE